MFGNSLQLVYVNFHWKLIAHNINWNTLQKRQEFVCSWNSRQPPFPQTLRISNPSILNKTNVESMHDSFLRLNFIQQTLLLSNSKDNSLKRWNLITINSNMKLKERQFDCLIRTIKCLSSFNSLWHWTVTNDSKSLNLIVKVWKLDSLTNS